MEYCPIFKGLLKFNLIYNYGTPFIFYSCDNCGYNSNKTINFASTSNIDLNLQNITMKSYLHRRKLNRLRRELELDEKQAKQFNNLEN